MPPHLIAGFIALTLISVSVASAPYLIAKQEPAALTRVLAQSNATKDLGVLLPSMANADPTLLPVFGSSELTRIAANRGDQFFLNAPTGFRVCPYGGPGNTTLLNAEKVAAMGNDLRNRKVVVLLSCSWFRRPYVPEDHYTGNFSPAQAIKIVLDRDMDPALRRRLIGRMLDYPGSLKEHSALHSYAHSLVTKHTISRWFGQSQWPMLELQRLALRLEDNLASLVAIWTAAPSVPAVQVATSTPFSWDAILSHAADYAPPPSNTTTSHPSKPGAVKNYDDKFIASFEESREWDDFNLLLDTFKAVHAQPLIVTIPLDGTFEETHGVTTRGRNYYYDRVARACAERGFAETHFPEHEMDSDFVISHSSHLSGKGWLFLNKLLDDFYHDRTPATAGRVTRS